MQWQVVLGDFDHALSVFYSFGHFVVFALPVREEGQGALLEGGNPICFCCSSPVAAVEISLRDFGDDGITISDVDYMSLVSRVAMIFGALNSIRGCCKAYYGGALLQTLYAWRCGSRWLWGLSMLGSGEDWDRSVFGKCVCFRRAFTHRKPFEFSLFILWS